MGKRIALIATTSSFFVVAVLWAGEPSKPRGSSVAETLTKQPGCLGAKSVTMDDGQKLVFAWFEDRQAIEQWCASMFHQAAQQTVRLAFPNATIREPLSAAPDEQGPFLVITAMRTKDKRPDPRVEFPFNELSMELYRPVPGGMFYKARFAPEGLKVAGMVEFSKK